MAIELTLPIYGDSRGKLSVVEKILPFEIKRIYYIYDCTNEPRGGHRHKKTIQALICVSGSCIIEWTNGKMNGTSELSKPNKLLILQPEDYHTMHSFTKDTVLLVLASELFDSDDYVDEDYS